MRKSYSVAEARINLPQILDEVEAGREVRLTRRGRPVAVVLSPRQYEMLRSEPSNFGEAYRAFRLRHPLEEAGLDQGFAESLRDRGPGRRARL